MRFYPTKIHLVFILFIFSAIWLNIGCSKDNDLLRDALLSETVSSVETTDSKENETPDPIIEEPEVALPEETVADGFENRTTSFPPLHDAHVQSGKGYNQNIIRLEEGNRTSYIMFDLSQIEAVGGTITDAVFEFTIAVDDGSGTINISRGISSDWTEGTLSDNNVPQGGVQLGTISKEFSIGQTELVELNASNIVAEKPTLIIEHENGNDLAFASKEHASKIGPKLVISYDVPLGTEEIVIPVIEATAEETNEVPVETNQEPMAVVDASPTGGGVPLEVTFQGGNSTDDNEIISYSWDFKDGSVSTEANPAHTFTQVGVYEAELTVTDASGSTNVDKVTITVTEEQNNAPEAIVSATPVSGEAPLAVSFKGSNSTDDHSIASYGWDFKDGSKTNIADFNYTYTNPGTYEAELTVTDENGLTDKKTITITVTESQNQPPNAIVSATPISGDAPLQVSFNGSSSTDDNSVTSYLWNFKDGTNSTSANPSHTFTQPGNYDVELTVSDEEGLTSKKTINISVNAVQNQAPIARISASITSGEVALNVQFTGDQSSDDNDITSYFWDFKDGSTANTANPYHTFNAAGNYLVELTVKDAAGLSHKVGVNIVANEPVINAPPGYYVATNGSANNNGQSPSSPWSLEHAFNTAQAGDVVYVKAGNYGRKDLLTKYGGTSGNPIKFIGYKNTPGDVNSNGSPTFNYGETVSASKMPLLSSSNGQGIAINVQRPYVHIENFQMNNYSTGIQTLDIATNLSLKNIIVTNSGNQYNSNAYDGFGITIRGNNSVVEDSFVLNAVAQGITLSDSDYSLVKNCRVYADNNSNPADYYVLLADGTNNSVVEKTTVSRGVGLSHNGHGFNLKNDATYNTFKNCTAIRTSFELTYFGVHHNTIDGGQVIGEGTNKWEARMVIVGGAHHNTIKNLNIKDTWTAISLTTFDDRTGLDASLGNDNIFDNVTVQNTDRIFNVGGGTNYLAKAKNYQFNNCNFSNFKYVAVALYGAENMKFVGCSFTNGEKFVVELDGVYDPYSKFEASWQNCSWSNVSFTPPN